MRKAGVNAGRVGRAALLVAACLSLFAGGVLACSGNYCEPIDTRDCLVIDEPMEDSCCVDVGGGQLRCATCSREMLLCFQNAGLLFTAGGAYNCHSPGATCR